MNVVALVRLAPHQLLPKLSPFVVSLSNPSGPLARILHEWVCLGQVDLFSLSWCKGTTEWQVKSVSFYL